VVARSVPASQAIQAAGPRRSLKSASWRGSHIALAVQTLVSIMEHGDKNAARVAAAQAILDGGWGKAVQALDMTGHYKTPMTPARKRRAGQHGSAVGPRHARSPLHRRRPSRHRGGHDVELFC